MSPVEQCYGLAPRARTPAPVVWSPWSEPRLRSGGIGREDDDRFAVSEADRASSRSVRRHLFRAAT